MIYVIYEICSHFAVLFDGSVLFRRSKQCMWIVVWADDWFNLSRHDCVFGHHCFSVFGFWRLLLVGAVRHVCCTIVFGFQCMKMLETCTALYDGLCRHRITVPDCSDAPCTENWFGGNEMTTIANHCGPWPEKTNTTFCFWLPSVSGTVAD